MVVVVSPKGLSREGSPAALAAKARDGMRPAFGLVGAKGRIEAGLWGSMEGAGAPGAEARFEHGPPCGSKDRRPLLLGGLRQIRSVAGLVCRNRGSTSTEARQSRRCQIRHGASSPPRLRLPRGLDSRPEVSRGHRSGAPENRPRSHLRTPVSRSSPQGPSEGLYPGEKHGSIPEF